MTIEVTYNVTDIYISSEVSPIYIDVNYTTGGGGAAVWGAITGTLSNQTDLQTALDGKFDNPTGDTTQYIAGDGTLITFPTTGQAGSLVREVRNTTGATLAKGTIVYISGATGNKATVSKAIATGDTTSAQTFGVVQAAIPNNSNGNVVVIGDLDGLDTSAFSEGAQLYLSSTVAGTWTTVKQYAPAHLVYIGIVTRSHPTQGQVEVRIGNGFELDELHNVAAQSPSNNDGIFYNTTTSLWEKKSIVTALGYTPIILTSLSAVSPLGYNNGTGAFSIQAASSSQAGYLTVTDWTTFNNKENALTFSSPLSRTTNTISIPLATSSVSGYLSSTDWSTFNSKQGALTLTTTGTSGAATLVGNTLNIPQYSGGGGMAIGGSITSATAGSVLFAGTSGVLAQDNTNLFWDNNNKRLGIGTNAPIQPLHIVSADCVIITRNTLNTGFSGTNMFDDTNTLTGSFAIGGTNTAQFSGHMVLGARKSTGNLYFVRGTAATFSGALFSTGNWLFQNGGTFTDAGYRLDVNGTGRFDSSLTVYANGSVGTNSSLTVNWSNQFIVQSNGLVRVNGALSRTGVAMNVNGKVSATSLLQYNGSNEFYVDSNPYIRSFEDFVIKFDTSNRGLYIWDSLSGTNNSSAKVQIDSTTKGFLPPRMTTTQKNAISTPVAGLVVYDTTLNKLCVYTTTWETITSV